MSKSSVDMLKQIEQVLDERVRPGLRLHGGDVRILDFSGGILQVKLLGQCSGCPSAYLTAEHLIEAEVTAALPAVKSVALVQQVEDSLLEQARAILNHQS